MNKKYHELLEDLDNNFKEAVNELGNDEAQALLTNRLISKPQIDIRKESEFCLGTSSCHITRLRMSKTVAI